VKTRIRSLFTGIFGLLILLSPQFSFASDNSSSVRRFYERAQQYVVNISSDHGKGTGFLINYQDNVYVVTAAHVVMEEAEVLDITGDKAVKRTDLIVSQNLRFALNDGQPDRELELVGFDDVADIAILKPKDKSFKPESFAVLGDSDALYPGDFLATVCSHLGVINFGLSFGRVIQTNIFFLPFVDRIASDVKINFGCSGGPAMNSKGQVVAINAAISTVGNPISIHTPINHLTILLPKLVKGGQVKHGDIAVRISDSWKFNIEFYKNLEIKYPARPGVIIIFVKQNSNAASSGLRKGDIILSYNGKEISQAVDFARWLILDGEPGQVIELKILRKHHTMTLKVKLEEPIIEETEIELPYNKK